MAIALAGNTGYASLGYERVAELRQWTAAFTREVRLGKETRGASGSAELVVLDPIWITAVPTRLELRLGSNWWVWDEVRGFDVSDAHVSFVVIGDPKIICRGEGHVTA